MPGEKAKIVRGPVVPIRVTAPVDMAAGDFYVLEARTTGNGAGQNGCVGFFPDAVKRGEKGTFIIAAHRVEVDRASGDTDAHNGATPVAYDIGAAAADDHLDRSTDALVYAGAYNAARRYLIGFVSDDTPADSATIQIHLSGVQV